MARGAHRSPQFLKSGKRTKSKNKTLKLIENNNAVLTILMSK